MQVNVIEQELEKEIVALEKKIKDNALLREKKMAEQVYLDEKARLDKALAMDVLSQEEYEAKLAVAKKKYDNFEQIRKVEQQFDMKLISREERDAKIKELSQ